MTSSTPSLSDPKSSSFVETCIPNQDLDKQQHVCLRSLAANPNVQSAFAGTAADMSQIFESTCFLLLMAFSMRSWQALRQTTEGKLADKTCTFEAWTITNTLSQQS